MVETAPKIQFFTRSCGANVAYAVHGGGPPLVIPAWWVSHLELDWQQSSFRDFFNALGEHHTVIRYDRPGVGLSDRTRASFTLEEEVDTLSEVIDHLAFGEVALLAVSCGGPPALHYALRDPARIAQLIFFGSFVSGASLGDAALQAAMCSLVKASWGMAAKTVLDLFDPEMPPELRTVIAKVHRRTASPEMAEALMRLTFAMEASEEASQLNIPALVLHRTKDNTVPFDSGRRLAALLGQAQLISLSGNAHLPWVGSDVDEVTAHILRFTGVVTAGGEEALELASQNQFKHTGDIWTLCYEGKTVHLKESRGLLDIARLIDNQNNEFHVTELAGDYGAMVNGEEGDVLDKTALRAYQARLIDIEDEKAVAADQDDDRQYLALEAEQDDILLALKQGLGVGQRQRKFSGPVEKARKAVSARVKAFVKRIASVHPQLAAHLEASLKTGIYCSYTTESRVDWLR